jgi:hypothetical protein
VVVIIINIAPNAYLMLLFHKCVNGMLG